MKESIFLFVLFCSINTAFAQNSTTVDEQSIRDARTASNTAIAKKDIGAVAKFWMNDYVEISSDGSLIAGKDAVMIDWEKMFANDPTITFDRELQELSFSNNGTLALEKGILKYSSYNYKGLYTALWRKIDGLWLTQMENFVSLY